SVCLDSSVFTRFTVVSTLTYLSLPFFFLMTPPPPRSTLFPYTTLFRSARQAQEDPQHSQHFGRLVSARLPVPHRHRSDVVIHGRRQYRQSARAIGLGAAHPGNQHFCHHHDRNNSRPGRTRAPSSQRSR